MKSNLLVRSSCAVLAAAALPAAPIVPGIDTTNWSYAGKFGDTSGFSTSAVAIGERWLLTARHAAGMGDADARFQLDSGQTFSSTRIIRHPTDDIAIIELSSTLLNSNWYPIFEGTNELGRLVEMVGYGLKGQLVNNDWEYLGGTYGTKRRATNNVSMFFTFTTGSVRGQFLGFDFDGNGINTFNDSGPTTDEGTLGGGDSGGPAFIDDAGVWKVAGIHSWVASGGGRTPPHYGSLCGSLRVSFYKNWINSIVPALVPPDGFAVTRGSLQSGGLAELINSDDSYMVVQQRPPFSAADPSVQLVVDGTAPSDTATSITFRLEASSTGAPSTNVLQRIELFDFQAGIWEQVDQRNPNTSDIIVEVTVTNNPARFIQGGTRKLRARIGFFDRGTLTPSWVARFDQVRWALLR